METRPAPLTAMSGNDGLDEFRVASPRDIGRCSSSCSTARCCST